MAFTPKEVAELNASLQRLLEIWMRIKLAIQKAFGKGAITRELEQAFLKLKSDLSRLYRVIGDRLPKELQFDGNEMIEMMKSATTMQNLHSLPLEEKRKVFSWPKPPRIPRGCPGPKATAAIGLRLRTQLHQKP